MSTEIREKIRYAGPGTYVYVPGPRTVVEEDILTPLHGRVSYPSSYPLLFLLDRTRMTSPKASIRRPFRVKRTSN